MDIECNRSGASSEGLNLSRFTINICDDDVVFQEWLFSSFSSVACISGN